MLERRRYIYLCLASLALGLGVYVFFKENSYLHIAAEQLLGLSFSLRTDCIFINNHLCDFLWAFSLTCGLIFILGETISNKLTCLGIAVGYGAAWEFLQYAHIVSGTGDAFDVLIYLLASVLAVFIFHKKEN